jgi:DNA-damage-inducible protein J
MSAVEVVRARIEPGLKKEATAVLSSMGLSVSDAIRLLLTRVATEKALPFEIRIPNAETREAIQEIRDGKVKGFDSVADLMADLND